MLADAAATRLATTARCATSAHHVGGCGTAFWLRRYLTRQQRAVLGHLSVFASAFDVAKAAAVLYGRHAGALGVAATDAMLRCLHGIGVLRRLRGTARGAACPSYDMHPQVWGIAHDFLQAMPATESRIARERFASLMLDVGARLTFCGVTAAARAEAAATLADEYSNLTELLTLLRGAVLLADAPRGPQRTPNAVVVMHLTVALAAFGQTVLAAFAAQVPGMCGKQAD